MSIYVTSNVWKFSRSKASTLLTALAIADFADDEGEAFPSIAKLAEKARVDDRTVQRALAELVELGELSIGIGEGPNRRNSYRVLVEKTPGNLSPRQIATPANATTPNKENHQKKKESASAKARITFNAQTGTFEGLTEVMTTAWANAYPGVNVRLEIQRAALWLIANPSRMKTLLAKFLTNWIGRASQRLADTAATGRTTSNSNVRPVNRTDRAAAMYASTQGQLDDFNIVDAGDSRNH